MSDTLTIHRRVCDQQPTGSRMCGYYAVASAVAICHGVDSSGAVFDPTVMVRIIDQAVATGVVEQVSVQQQGARGDRGRAERKKQALLPLPPAGWDKRHD